jgi:CDP-glucose 4,6-dehydratase
MKDEAFWRGRRVLVTGATGVVGSTLVESLLGAGAEVVALVADHDPRSRLIDSGMIDHTTVVNGRLEDYATVERSVNDNDVTAVFHLGAQAIVGVAQRSPLPTFEANIRGTYHVLEACRRLAPMVTSVVVASSDKAYGDSEALPYTEDMPLAASNPYDVSKACTDLLAQSYAASYGMPVGIARSGNIYGPGDWNWSRIIPGTIRSLLLGTPPIVRSDGSPTRDYIFVEDVVDGLMAIGQHLEDEALHGEAFNFGNESPLSVLDLVKTVSAAVGRTDLEPDVLGSAPGEIKDQWLSAAKARATLAWKPKHTLDQGIAKTIPWYRERIDSNEA